MCGCNGGKRIRSDLVSACLDLLWRLGSSVTSVWSTFCSQLLEGSKITASSSATTSSLLPTNTPTTSFSPTTSFVGQLSQMPGWTNLRSCVTNAVAGGSIERGILYYVGCQDYACACSDAGSGIYIVSSCLNILLRFSCSSYGRLPFGTSFCSQLLLGSAVDGSPTSRRLLT